MHYRRLVVFPLLAALASMLWLPSSPAAAQGSPGTIEGQVWRDSLRNFLRDPGEPAVVGAQVELWHTTSFAGQPLRIQVSQTDSQGRYRFAGVNPINGPLPDFGCYQVWLTLPLDLGGGVTRSQEICQLTAGGTAGMDFALPGGSTPPPPPPPGSTGVIQGTVFQDVNGNRLPDAGEPPVAGAAVELWQTTSISGQPLRVQTTQTDAQGHYQFTVNAFSGPTPDFGCYEVRVRFSASLTGDLLRSQPICQVAPGVILRVNFAVPGGTTPPPPPPPPPTNQAPEVLFIRVEPAGTQVGGTVRLQALGIDPDDDCLSYQWVIPAGTISSNEGPLIDWTAPAQPGTYTLRVIATDSRGAAAQKLVEVPVTPSAQSFNQPPLLETINATDLTPALGQTVRLSIAGFSDPNGDPLTNGYYVFGGARAARVSNTDLDWQAFTPGIYSVYNVLSDGKGGFGWAKRELSVNSAQTLNRAHPSYGRAGQVLIESFGYLLWVGINDPAVAQQAAALAASGAERWVIGRVAPDPSQRHCFYLAPDNISFAEVTAEGIQTTVEQVSRRPAFYAPGGGGGFDTWALSGRLLEFVPAQ